MSWQWQRPLSLPAQVGRGWAVGLGAGIAWLASGPAFAHHALGGRLPATGWEGFLSGLAHPVIGPDHLAFVVAIGLIAARQPWRYGIPLGFVLAGLVGTGIHLAGWDPLGLTELVIASSVVLFGLLLAQSRQIPSWLLLLWGSLAGLFHGYAYAEAIIGAEPMPWLGYLLGLSLVQYGVALFALWAAETWGSRIPGLLRWAGWAIAVVGSGFLALAVVGS
ncbi:MULTISPECIES: HupE/UreJ family protein [unclassified Synechococcus]|uniref:HupE/UreJ family protein n=1 Tax=unclassified Synechococcus TaxID=2626047 RepID=UPI000C445335|nr:HupE/UreJ family protein [Synechococcus sp. 65AY6A5]PIK88656.1 urease accessory protein UreJ [Synechococcus sp. 65AY6A5]